MWVSLWQLVWCVLEVKHLIVLPKVSIRPLPIPSRPWSHIVVDFVTGLPPSNGHTAILTIVDRFSKMVHYVPLAKLPSATKTADLLALHVFRLH